jgi:hypothetical protein
LRWCEAGEVVDEQPGVDRFDGERDPRLVVDEDEDRVVDVISFGLAAMPASNSRLTGHVAVTIWAATPAANMTQTTAPARA